MKSTINDLDIKHKEDVTIIEKEKAINVFMIK